jgi:hypothetical protein
MAVKLFRPRATLQVVRPIFPISHVLALLPFDFAGMSRVFGIELLLFFFNYFLFKNILK